jgi:hypothetical protein
MEEAREFNVTERTAASTAREMRNALKTGPMRRWRERGRFLFGSA